jgi:hypothetical protein
LLFYDFAALGSLLATLVFRTALVYSGRFLFAGRPASWPPIINWLWRFAWMLWLLAAITFVVLRIRYPVGGDITISPHVPLMEHVLQVLALGGVVGGYIIVWAWWIALAIYEARVRSRGHERHAAAMRQQLSPRRGHTAADIVLLIMALVMVAALAFLIIVLVMVINFLLSV